MPTTYSPSRWLPNDVRSAHRAALAMQVSLHASILDMLRTMGRFTVLNLTQTLVRANPFIPREVIERFAGETIDNFQHLLEHRAGIYQVKTLPAPQTREQTMQMFRDVVRHVCVVGRG